MTQKVYDFGHLVEGDDSVDVNAIVVYWIVIVLISIIQWEITAGVIEPYYALDNALLLFCCGFKHNQRESKKSLIRAQPAPKKTQLTAAIAAQTNLDPKRRPIRVTPANKIANKRNT